MPRASEWVEKIRLAYPRKIGKLAAQRAIERAIERESMGEQLYLERTCQEILASTQAFALAVQGWPANDQRFVPHPSTWFNQGRYDDDPTEWRRGKAKPKEFDEGDRPSARTL